MQIRHEICDAMKRDGVDSIRVTFTESPADIGFLTFRVPFSIQDKEMNIPIEVHIVEGVDGYYHLLPCIHSGLCLRHPNIADNGSVCISVNGSDDDHEWTSVWFLVTAVIAVLQEPNFDDPVSNCLPCKDLEEYYAGILSLAKTRS